MKAKRVVLGEGYLLNLYIIFADLIKKSGINPVQKIRLIAEILPDKGTS